MKIVLSGRACGLVVAGVMAWTGGICRGQDAADDLLRQAVADRQGQVSPGDKAKQLQRAGDLADDERRLAALVEEQRQAEVDLIVRAVHLRSLQAEAMLIQGRNADALEVVDELIEKISRLPDDVDRNSMLKELRNLANRATGRRTARDLTFTPRRYMPGRAGPSVAESVARNAERLVEEGEVQRGYKSDEAQTLLEVGRDRGIPQGLLTYPDDWPEITRRRKEYADGTFYKSDTFRASDGQMVYTAIYDLRDLMMDVPDFADAPEMDLEVTIRNLGDRYWLQRRSQIYGGWADDLAAGVPLLRFFGGIDESNIPPSSNAARQRYQEVMAIIDDVLGSGSDADAANH